MKTSARVRREQQRKRMAQQEKTTRPTTTTSGRAKQRRQVRTPFWRQWWIIGVVVVVLFAVGIFLLIRSQPGPIDGVVTYSNLSRDHVSGKVTYPQNPPVGGSHNSTWQTCGIYSQPIANENAVHSLEHGAIWITYQPGLDTASIAQLQGLVHGHDHALLSPYPGLPSPIVVSAWGIQLQVKSASDPRLAQFVSKYEQGPQTPEPGATCSGGTGTPDAQ